MAIPPILGTATAAAVLAELHGVKAEREADVDVVCESSSKVPRGLSIAISHQLIAHR